MNILFYLCTAQINAGKEINLGDEMIGYYLNPENFKPCEFVEFFPQVKEKNSDSYQTLSVNPNDIGKNRSFSQSNKRKNSTISKRKNNRYSLHKKNERVVNKVDGRKQIKDTSSWPNSVHGFIKIYFNKSMHSPDAGSGILVGPWHALTAAHNIYDKNEGGWINSASFYAGRDRNNYNFSASVVMIITFKPYIDSEKENYDMALLILDKNIDYKAGWFGIMSPSDKFLENRTVTITGYPEDRGYEMHSMAGKMKKPINGFLHYDIDTNKGQSGSGIYVTKNKNGNERHYVIGVHTAGDLNKNTGVRLSKERFNCMYHGLKFCSERNIINLSFSSKNASLSFLEFLDEIRPIIGEIIKNRSLNKKGISFLKKYLQENRAPIQNSFRNLVLEIEEKPDYFPWLNKFAAKKGFESDLSEIEFDDYEDKSLERVLFVFYYLSEQEIGKFFQLLYEDAKQRFLLIKSILVLCCLYAQRIDHQIFQSLQAIQGNFRAKKIHNQQRNHCSRKSKKARR